MLEKQGEIMTKSIIFLLMTISLFVSPGFVSNSAAHQFITPTSTPKSKKIAEIEKIELNKKEIFIPCPLIDRSPQSNQTCFDYEMSVNVSTFVSNPKNLALSYNYTVSGGSIIGEGKNVIWKLQGVNRGIYTIKVAISGKGRISKEIKTHSIEVSACNCPHICFCPILSVSSDGNVKAGANVTFTAKLEYNNLENIKYKWTVSQGEIVEGQGTSTITVKTTREMIGQTIKATVFMEHWDLCEDCPKVVSETVLVVE